MPTRSAPVRRAPVALAIAALSACTGGPAGEAVTPGPYIGDVTWNAAEPPIGMHFEVLDGPRIRLVDAPYFRFPAEDAPLTVTGDTVRFALRTAGGSRPCTLRVDHESGWLRGECGPADDAWTLRLRPRRGFAEPTGLAAGLLESGEWRSAAGRRARVHVRPSAPGAAAEFVPTADSLAEQNLRWLGVPDADGVLDLFLVADRAEIARVTGRRTGGWADAYGTAAVVAGHGSLRTVARHEMMHVQSHTSWGEPHGAGDWLREGVAVAATGECAGWGLQPVAARLRLDAALLPLEELVERFREQDDLIAYLQAGAFVDYIHRTHGAAAVEALWKDGDDGLRGIAGRSLEALDRRWRDTLAEHTAEAASVDIESGIRATGRGCG